MVNPTGVAPYLIEHPVIVCSGYPLGAALRVWRSKRFIQDCLK